MSNFYLSDPAILKITKLTDREKIIYQYCCSQFNIKKLTSFIRLVDIAGLFQTGLAQVQKAMQNLAATEIDGFPLIKIVEKENYLAFEMPRHIEFLKQIGYTINGSSKGWSALKVHTSNIGKEKNPEIKYSYDFDHLGMYQLQEHLEDMTKEEFAKVNRERLAYKWIYDSVKKYRENR